MARHLLAHYDVPRFMDQAWFETDEQKGLRYQGWFKHVGMGGNIRKADLPLGLSKRMAHLFLQADEALTIEGALRWAQVRARDGSRELARAVIGTRLGEHFDAPEFWDGFILYLTNHPMLDPGCVGAIVDYIHYQRFVPVETVAPDGRVVVGEPPQADFSLKGRRMEKLLAQVEEWHLELAKETRKPEYNWPRSGIGEFELIEDAKKKDDQRRWTIRELLSTRDLVEEGRALRHCVASYERNCKRGHMSIWSLKVQHGEKGRVRPVMTIAVDRRTRRITQAAGKHNAQPKSYRPKSQARELTKSYLALLNYSQRMVKAWMQREGLS